MPGTVPCVPTTSRRHDTPRGSRSRRREPERRVLGVEIDAARVTGVLLVGNTPAQVLHGHGDSIAQRLKDVASRAGPVTAVHVTVVHADATAVPSALTGAMANRAEFTRFAHTLCRTRPELTYVAAITNLGDLTAGSTAPAMVVTCPRPPVDEVYRTLHHAHVRVGTPPSVVERAEGLSLAIRDTHVELSLVNGGRLLASTILPVSGLHQLEQTLGQGNVVGTTRLGAVLHARTLDPRASDPEALGLLDRYLRQVAAQCQQLITAWELAGHPLHRTVYVHGRGATTGLLAGRLTEVGLTVARGTPMDSALAPLGDPSDRPALVTAYLSALAAAAPSPPATFPNPAAVRDVVDQHSRSTRLRRRAWVGAAAVAALAGPLVAAAPATLANISATSAWNSALSAASEQHGVPVPDLEGLARAASDDGTPQGTDLADVLTLLTNLPEGARTTGLHVSNEQVRAQVQAADPAAVLSAASRHEASPTSSKYVQDLLTLTWRGTS